ncbi:MAG: ComEC family competence protein [Maribacter sp.]|nr:ComEC family competence protein [Maribacter sp.]
MHLLKFIPIKLTLLLVLGILVGYFYNPGIEFPAIFTVVFLSTLGVILVKQKKAIGLSFGIIAALTTICLGMLITALSEPKNANDHYSNLPTNEPETWKLKVTEELKSNSFSERYIAEVLLYNTYKATGKVLLQRPIDTTNQRIQVDDEIVVCTTKDKIKPPLNPYQFNYKNFIQKQGIYDQLKLNTSNFVVLENPSRSFKGFAAALRENIILKLKQADFGEDQFTIIQALFLGQRDAISTETYTDYKNAGAVHILAVSGLHIGILLLFLEFLLRPIEIFRNGKDIKLVLIVILLWGFAFLAGLSASVVRAVTMFSFVAYAMYLNRPSNTFNILALSMFFILLVFDPLHVFNVGFQMSYAAVFAIVWVYPILQKFWYPKNWLARKVWQLLSVSIAAQLGVLPLSLFYFHQFPGLFFISNLLIVPFLGLILGLGIIVIILILLNIAPNFLIELYNLIIGLMNSVIKWVAQQEAFIFSSIPFDVVQLVLTYGLFIAMIWMVTKKSFKNTLAFLLCIIGLQLWSLYNQKHTHEKEQLLLAHQTKHSILAHQKGNELNIFTTDSVSSEYFTTTFQIAERIEKIKYHSITNAYRFKENNIRVLDSLGMYSDGTDAIDYLILTQSPKINLDRLIDSIRPKVLIADGSNYHSYISRWEQTCIKKELPFHYTGEKGAYIFKFD